MNDFESPLLEMGKFFFDFLKNYCFAEAIQDKVGLPAKNVMKIKHLLASKFAFSSFQHLGVPVYSLNSYCAQRLKRYHV